MGTVRRAAAVGLRRIAANGPFLAVIVLAVASAVVAVHVPSGSSGAGVAADIAVGLGVLAGLGVMGAPAASRRGRLLRSGIADVDRMAGEEFEALLADALRSLGYDVARTRRVGDFGADLVLERNGTRTVAQAKRYNAPVRIDAVQQVIGARRYYDAEGAVVVTNSSLTRAAITLAETNGVEVMDRQALTALLATQASVGRPADGGLRLLLRQVACGIQLTLYALWCALRLVWWLVASARRVVGAALRMAWATVR